MSEHQQIGTKRLGRSLRVIINQVSVEQSLKDHNPDLVVLPLPRMIPSNLNEFFSIYRPSLVETARRIVRNRETAEDVVQEALVKAYNNLKHRRPYVLHKQRVEPLSWPDAQAKRKKKKGKNECIEDMEAWLRTIVCNVALNYLKRQKQIHTEDISQLVDREDKHKRFENPAEFVERTEREKELHALVEALPSSYASAIRLRFFQEYEYQMIADELHCPLGTVKSSINRGLSMLREALQGQRAVENGRMVKRRKVIVG